jgi:signal transduction histidine kinase
MKKISRKVILIGFLTMVLAGGITRIIIQIIVGVDLHQAFTEGRVFNGVLIILAMSLTLFAYIINHFIVKRIKKIDEATIRVKDGYYDFELDTSGKDEITNLSKNFNLMINALKSNEYVNKEFVRNFSHELKTPLSAIKGYAELISQNELTTEERTNYLDIIIHESERLSHLSNNMLQISLVDSMSIVKRIDHYNFAEQIRKVIQIMQMSWEEKKLSFDLDLEEIQIRNNKELTYQILLNLISNAIEFSYQNTEIQITLKDLNDEFQFSITNQGQSIPKEDFEKVFQLFYITDKTKHETSTGVGLTLTKKIVDKLEGSISFQSEEGITTFEVFLPKLK